VLLPSATSSLLLMRREGHSRGTPGVSTSRPRAEPIGESASVCAAQHRGNLGFRFPESVGLLNLDN
jgi:hypothetical protein